MFARQHLPLVVTALLLVVGGCETSSSSSKTETSNTSETSNTPETPEPTQKQAQAQQDDGGEAVEAPQAESNDAPAPTEYPFDQLWVGYLYKGRMHIDLGSSDPFPDTDSSVEQRGGPETTAYDAKAIRAPFRGVTDVDVLTPSGPVTLALVEVERETRGPDADIGFELLTDASDTLEDIDADHLILAPAGQMAASATYRPAKTSELSAQTFAELEKTVLAELPPAARAAVEKGSLEKLDQEWRDKLKYADSATYETKPGLAEGHFEAVEGEFAGPYTHFVVVNGREGIDAVGIEFNLVRAALFATDDATETETVAIAHGPEYKWGHAANTRATPLALIDLDGDGVEGVFFELDKSLRLADFVDGRLVERTLP